MQSVLGQILNEFILNQFRIISTPHPTLHFQHKSSIPLRCAVPKIIVYNIIFVHTLTNIARLARCSMQKPLLDICYCLSVMNGLVSISDCLKYLITAYTWPIPGWSSLMIYNYSHTMASLAPFRKCMSDSVLV